MTIAKVLNGFRLFAGEKLNEIINSVNTLVSQAAGGATGTYTGTFAGTVNGALGGTTPAAASVTDLTQNGIITNLFQTAAAAGASQGAATAITKSVVIVTVTASTEGVKLPTAATGKMVRVHCPGSVGVKVYPFSGDAIDGGSANAAQLLVAGKANIYQAKDATNWYTMKGA